jgi:superfamily II DNA or RNA helicase
MNNYFKKQLYDRYYDTSADLEKIKSEKDYEKIIALGVRAEQGENYYTFYYSIPTSHGIRMEVVAMLYRAYSTMAPMDIHFSDSEVSFEVKDRLIRTAVYFLRNKFKDTTDREEKRVQLFAKKLRVANLKKEKDLTRDFKQLKREGITRESEVIIDELATGGKEPLSEKLKTGLAPLLKDKPGRHNMKPSQPGLSHSDLSQKDPQEDSLRKRPPARVGLCLEIREPNEEEKELLFTFHPLLVPVLKSGGSGKPRKMTRSLLSSYDVQTDNIPQILIDFMKRFVDISSEKQYDLLKTRLLNEIFFPELGKVMHTLSDELSYFMFSEIGAAQSTKKYGFLKKRIFQKISLRFVPSLKEAGYFSTYLQLEDSSGKTVKAGTQFVIKIIIDKVYLFFRDQFNRGYFTIPEEQNQFMKLFAILEEFRQFPISKFDTVTNAFKGIGSDKIDVIIEPLKKFTLNYLPEPVLKLTEKNHLTGSPDRLKLEFNYEGPVEAFKQTHPDMDPLFYEDRHKRSNRDYEELCLHFLNQDPLLEIERVVSDWQWWDGCYFHFKDNNCIDWLTANGAFYLDRGFTLFSTKWNRAIGKVGSGVSVALNHGLRWLEFKPTIIDPDSGEEIEIQDIDLDQGVVIDVHGIMHLVTTKEIEKLKRLYMYAEKQEDVFRIPSENYMLLEQLYDKRMAAIPELKARLKTAKKLRKLEEIPDYTISSLFHGKLRKYQQVGYRWLRFLHQFNFSGCLADDMGLGKTVQTLALLGSLKGENKLTTSLLVAPVSALPNWELEVKRFTPTISTMLHVGLKRTKSALDWKKVDLIITSYATLRQDLDIFESFSFDYIILDESQNIKNVSSQVSHAVKVMNAKHRLALSGTPVENNSLELWSLFDFLMPGFLGERQWFSQQFSTPIEKEQNEDRAEVLRQMVYPFILRRRKEEVEIELPEKIEILSHLEMSDEQMSLYRNTAASYRQQLEQEIDAKGVGGSSVKILEALLRLRQLCLFPQLVNPDYASIPSTKFNHFLELMEDILSEGHKVLIFSQFVQVLHILRNHFDKESIRYSYLDGSMDVHSRGRMIANFQEDESVQAFFLSLKAGGTAINLTAADYVIIFDPWWNPAVEAQAIDRSHRIGQTRKVIVYRLVTEHTIEEKVVALQQKKRELVDRLITTDKNPLKFKQLGKSEILDLFSLP